MFKRANKITALLVAAASVMSIVPAMAADVTRLGTKEGTIENAVAFKDGKYAFEGYKTNSDNKSVYYNAGDKDKELTALTDADLEGTFSDKYAYAVDGSDEYLVDLTDGKVIDDETPEDKKDTAATKLKTALKKTDRYGDSIKVTGTELTRIENGPKFGDTWYKYEVTPTDGDLGDNGIGGALYGYTDGSGKYIDASNTANIYAYSSAKQRVVKIDTFSNKANDGDSNTKLQAELIEAPKYLAHDKDNIYQLIKVKVTDYNDSTTSVSASAKFTVNFPTNVDDAAFKGGRSTGTIDWTKIGDSKFTSGGSIVIGGATFTYTPTPTVAQVTAGTHYKDLASLKAAVSTFFSVDSNKTTYIPNYEYSNGVFTAKTIGVTASAFAGDQVDVVKFIAGKTSTFTVNGVTFNYTTTGTADTDYKDVATLKSAVNKYFTTHATSNYYYANGVFTAMAGHTAASSDVTGEVTYSGSVTGGTVTAGKVRSEVQYIQKISKTQGDTKDDAYLPKNVTSYELSKNYYDSGDGDDAADHAADATDWTVINGTLAAIRVNSDNVRVTPINLKKDKVKFDSSSLPAGIGTDDKVDVYLAEKGDDGDTDVKSTGNKYTIDVDGNVWAIYEGKIKKFVIGSDFKNQYTCDRSMDSIDVYDDKNLIAWDQSGDVYTAVNEGTKVTQDESTAVKPEIKLNWDKNADGTWSFYDQTGAKVVSKWINVGGSWYYLKADGIMATGWYNDNGTWYYLNPASGAMVTGWVNDNGTWYYTNSSGAMVTGWVNVNGSWYYLSPYAGGPQGSMKTGWINDNGTWYYLNGSGAMLANTTVDGYRLGASGAWIR